MTTIYLLRHAKSRWDEPDVADHERGLAPRGQRDAPAMGRHARANGWLPDLVLCSTATRAAATAQAFLEAAGIDPEIRHVRSIYMAEADHLLSLLQQEKGSRIMLVGHDPGIHELALKLAGKSASRQLREKFPTAGLAVIDLPDLGTASDQSCEGTLRAFVRPKDLEPSSG